MERVEREGLSAIDAVCAEHPAHAPELRRRFLALADLGLLEGPRTFGNYRVLRTLGQGGMGIVYLARDEAMGRLVALKALPARLSTNPRALARFQREIKAVAQLRHPGIVPIYAMGHEDGVPYFTMEHVEGRTLAELVSQVRGLGLRPELLTPAQLAPRCTAHSWVEAVCRIGVDVAEALQHAHEHGVVHRDVKPSNILLRPDGRALLFDFGLARVEDAAGLTLTGDLAGTPYYVSPEQVSGSSTALDGRTDVFSLGVTLYELLTLDRPFDGKTTEQVLRQIAHREPDLPRRRNPAIPRDLQTICLTALEKDPARRYASAGDLAADLRALLDLRPVRARPVGTARRAGRYVRRNPALSAAALLGALLLVGTPVGLAVANARIRAQADRATAEAQRAKDSAQAALDKSAKAKRALQYLVSVLTSVDPLRDDRDLPMADVVKRATEQVGPALADEPFAEGLVRQNLGLTLRDLGLYAEAEAQFRRAIEVVAAAPAGDRDHLTALALDSLAVVLARTGRTAEAQAAMLQALGLAASIPSLTAAHTTLFLEHAALIRQLDGDIPGAHAGYTEVLARLRTDHPEEDPRVVTALLNVAGTAGDPAQAEALGLQALAIQERTLAPDDPQLAQNLGNLAIARFLQDDAPGAETLQRRALELLRLRLGPAHVDVLDGQVVLAILRGAQGAHDEAAALLDVSLAGYRTVFPGGHPRVVTAMRRLADEWHALGRDDPCVSLLQDALAMQQRVDGQDDNALALCRTALAAALRRLHRDAEAEALSLAPGS